MKKIANKLTIRKETLTSLEQVTGGGRHPYYNNTVYYPPASSDCPPPVLQA